MYRRGYEINNSYCFKVLRFFVCSRGTIWLNLNVCMLYSRFFLLLPPLSRQLGRCWAGCRHKRKLDVVTRLPFLVPFGSLLICGSASFLSDRCRSSMIMLHVAGWQIQNNKDTILHLNGRNSSVPQLRLHSFQLPGSPA